MELLSLADIDRDDVVGEARFFEENRDFMPIGSRPVVKVDHGGAFVSLRRRQ